MGEIISELIFLIGRIVLHIAIDIVFEILIKGVGYLIINPFSRSVDPDGAAVVLVGLAFWITLVVIALLSLA